MNYVSRLEPVYSKSLKYFPIIIRLASLLPDSGDYTLRVMKKVFAVKFARGLDVTLEFNCIEDVKFHYYK